uniref:F-box domain-containing protein n=1 Tax=Setaria viridis TaxID=4556 RepID=A0A4U6T0M8_SETVI|nr:hypothetical protein SEVIR_9G298900v2 [Setaria viridis]
MATFLHKFVDAEQWEAEDDVGRLGLVAHAAFLHAGFLPYGAKPRSGQLRKQAGDTGSSSFLSRRYTAPELAHHDSAETAVLMLCKGEGGDFALFMYLTTDRDMRRTYRHLDDTDPWGSRFCRWLADGACWGLLVELCRRNGLPLTVFTSLPEDVVVEILKRVGDGEALARAACASRLLRRLVAAYDVELWKPLYEAAVGVGEELYMIFFFPKLSEGFISWKWRCAKVLQLKQFFSRPIATTPPIQSNPRNARGKRGERRCRHPNVPLHDDYGTKRQDSGDVQSPERIATEKSAEGHRHKVPRYDWNRKRRHVAGAIHSPSSRYRWNHR